MYELAIIGAGWAGFNAALRAKELGLKVCLIDSGQIGGTCLHYGCIPTKTLIACAKIFSLAQRSSHFGIALDNLRVNFVTIQEKKDKVIRQLSLGMQTRLAGIDFINSPAQIISTEEVSVDGRMINTKFILIATGSQPLELADLKFDQKKIISSNQALDLLKIPESLLVIGGGVIGCEFASLFSALGSRVTIAEKMPLLLPTADREVSKKIEVIFKKKGIKVVTGADRSSFDLDNYSKILVCVGRAPHIDGLGLDNLGVELKNNRIVVDDYLKSSRNNIYAAGDCTAKVMLAHYAAYQGVLAVQNMVASDRQTASNLAVPVCIFTEPQIASVGLNQEEAMAAGLKIKIHKFDFRANALAQIIDEVEGWVKIISNPENGRIIGASIIGPQATELICSLVVAIEARLTINQIRGMIFAHPTLSESLHEALSKS
jgi:dihydrolipoamide dehydrogenase